VTLIERSARLGRGVAYGACDHAHLLNVPLARMEVGLSPSLKDWLTANRPDEIPPTDAGGCFITRRSFGDYIEAVTERHVASGRLARLRGDVVEIGRNGGPYALLRDGRLVHGTHVVLATGNLPPKTPRIPDEKVLDSPLFVPDPWRLADEKAPAKTDDVLLIGSGLTMVDVALRLKRDGHAGRLVAVSRHGLLPNRHADGGEWRNAFDLAPSPPLQALRTLRREAREATETGVPWQRVIDAIRPSLANLWISWSEDDRRRFLRHCRTTWDVHRHRMARRVSDEIEQLRSSGGLAIMAGRIAALKRTATGANVLVRPRGKSEEIELDVQKVINCTGPRSSFDDLNDPLFKGLKDRGLLVADGLGLGVKTFGCAVLDRYAIPSDWLFAIGPLTRPEWWEITAVPEISAQCTYLANDLGKGSRDALLRGFVDLGSGI